MNSSTEPSKRCMCCGSTQLIPFYSIEAAPVNSVLLLTSQTEALNFQCGTIILSICELCGFISNLAFDPELLEYSHRYESTQSYSPTYNRFAQTLVDELIARHDLHNKRIIEIGCGQGEFLSALCAAGDNHGIGFDPAYRSALAHPGAQPGQTHFIADTYSAQYAHHEADFICCKMTLEHIADVGRFVASVRQAIGDRLAPVVFFQVPNMQRILEKGIVWDIYYEHCSYFTPTVLSDLFTANGFDVIDVRTAYDEQYILLDARPVSRALADERAARLRQTEPSRSRIDTAMRFAALAETQVQAWNQRLDGWAAQGQHGLLWGGGSKAVAFLTALGRTSPLLAAIDINPNKQGTFLPGSGLEIISPSALTEIQPDFIVLMNPVYMDEISQTIAKLGIHVPILPLA